MSSNFASDENTGIQVKKIFDETKEIFYEEDIIRCHKKNIKVCKDQCGNECTTYCGKEDLHSYFELHCDQIDELEEKLGKDIVTNSLKYLTELLHQYIDKLDPNFVNLKPKNTNPPNKNTTNLPNKNKKLFLNITNSDVELKTNAKLKSDVKLKTDVELKTETLNLPTSKKSKTVDIYLNNSNQYDYRINYDKNIGLFDDEETLNKKKKAEEEFEIYRKWIDPLVEAHEKKLQADTRTDYQKREDYKLKLEAMKSPESNIYFAVAMNPVIK